MEKIEEMLRNIKKPKLKVQKIAGAVLNREIPAKEFIGFFLEADDKDKGTCADVMKHVSAENPGLLSKHIAELIKYINYPQPRVMWGVPEAIGNMAAQFPAEAASAIPNLLKNTAHESTVVRWCAAYALCKIAKSDVRQLKKLKPVFDKILKKEKNNGVRNVYLKSLSHFTD
jgi:hypothetical protein